MSIYDADARRQYKAQARADIRARFWPTMGASLLAMIPIALITAIYELGMPDTTDVVTMQEIGQIYAILGIYLAFMLFVGAPVQYGAKHYFVARARGQQASVSLVFSSFANGRQYLTSIKLVLCIIVRSLGWIILLTAYIIAVMVIAVFGYNWALLVIGLVLAIPVAMLVAVKIRRFDGAYICMIDTPDASVWEAVGACASIFKNHNWELMVFDLSFLLWQLASGITAGIVGIYVSAYTEMAFVNYFDALCGRERQPKQTDVPQFPE